MLGHCRQDRIGGGRRCGQMLEVRWDALAMCERWFVPDS